MIEPADRAAIMATVRQIAERLEADRLRLEKIAERLGEPLPKPCRRRRAGGGEQKRGRKFHFDWEYARPVASAAIEASAIIGSTMERGELARITRLALDELAIIDQHPSEPRARIVVSRWIAEYQAAQNSAEAGRAA